MYSKFHLTYSMYDCQGLGVIRMKLLDLFIQETESEDEIYS